jgi:hypothetical protein
MPDAYPNGPIRPHRKLTDLALFPGLAGDRPLALADESSID